MHKDTIRNIQLRQLDILKHVVELFEENDIEYFAIGGTALGAIRHGGFIPWDDDIDIAVLRDDYEKLLNLKDSFNDGLKLFSYELDRRFPLCFAKVYDMEYDYFCYSNRKNDVPRKIFIDIFPWDNLEDFEKTQRDTARLRRAFRRLIYKKNGSVIDKIKFPLYKLVYGFRSSSYYYNKIKSLVMASSGNSAQWGHVFQHQDYLDYNDIFPLRKIKFENTYINVPNSCEKYLKQKYGDYMTLPPLDKRVNHSRGMYL